MREITFRRTGETPLTLICELVANVECNGVTIITQKSLYRTSEDLYLTVLRCLHHDGSCLAEEADSPATAEEVFGCLYRREDPPSLEDILSDDPEYLDWRLLQAAIRALPIVFEPLLMMQITLANEERRKGMQIMYQLLKALSICPPKSSPGIPAKVQAAKAARDHLIQRISRMTLEGFSENDMNPTKRELCEASRTLDSVLEAESAAICLGCGIVYRRSSNENQRLQICQDCKSPASDGN